MSGHATTPGLPWPMGATLTGEGVNFAVFSAHAEAMELCLFTPDGQHEVARLRLRERDGDIWHIHVGGIGVGTVYGWRAHGPWRPREGHRFNPAKLLLDPYARALRGRIRWSEALLGHRADGAAGEVEPDSRDSAPFMAKAVVSDPAFAWGDDRPPRHAPERSLIYEAHVRGLTRCHPGVAPPLRGTFAGLASDPVIDHLLKLGVTAVQLMPIQAIADEPALLRRGLVNYWGYNTLAFLAPEPRYLAGGGPGEVQAMVRRLHGAGIEVILDIVLNHSGEGDERGPTLSFRGLDNLSYYRLDEGRGRYRDDAGTGNTLDLAHPMVLRLAMDCLRHWVEAVHVDGFRFDLATVLGRGAGGFDPRAPFFAAIRQDPVLAGVKLIAEPWDLGPGGYRLGEFPPPFLEWNDRFRDGARRFWRGDAGMAADLAGRLLASAERFDHSGRAPAASVNLVTSHDGFTLEDLVSFTARRNRDNGEENRDGSVANHSDNLGHEGPTRDPAILAARALRKRNLLATLFLAQGLPMLRAGDEIGHSQQGNNNAYAQDNAISWLDWAAADSALAAFVARLAALRRAHPQLRQRRFLHGRRRAADGLPDVIWRRADGKVPGPADWHDPAFRCLGLELRMAAAGRGAAGDGGGALFALFNGGPALALVLPDTAPEWELILDTTRPGLTSGPAPAMAPAQSVLLLRAATGDRCGEEA